jgi:hypothetical protein
VPVTTTNTVLTGDIVRVVRGAGLPFAGLQGVVIGFYVNDPPTALVRIRRGGVMVVPLDAVELVGGYSESDSAPWSNGPNSRSAQPGQ